MRSAGVLETFARILTDYLAVKKTDAPLSRSDSFLTNKIIAFIGQIAQVGTLSFSKMFFYFFGTG